jgi:glucose/arabinose dehydrogenase
MHVHRASIAVLVVTMLACGGQQPPAPPSTTPSPEQTVTSNDRLGWDQTAADFAELATFHYAIFVDGTRSELADVTCATSSNNGSFSCNAHLPTMSPGRHVLELSTFVLDGGSVLESARSSGIQVNFAGIVVSESRTTGANGASRSSDAVAASPSRTDNGAAPVAEMPLVAGGLNEVSDLAFAPDGRLFVAERTGQIRVMRNGTLLPRAALESPLRSTRRNESDGTADGAGSVVALAVDPQFDRTRFVFVLSTGISRRGQLSFELARYREAADTLADRAVLLDDIPASPDRTNGALRFGPDGKLYVAFDAGVDPDAAGDLSSPSGKVLRLNPDGSTPDDQMGASPLFSSAYLSPRGIGWDTDSGMMWIVDGAGAGSGRLSAVAIGSMNTGKRGVTKTTVSLPQDDDPSALVFLRKSVLVASVRGEPLRRGRIDPSDPTRIMQTEALIGSGDGVRAMAVGPDGALYVATSRAISRLQVP